MTEPHPEPDLEGIAFDCLARFEAEGQRALDQACERHPEHAMRLRGMVAQLGRVGLIDVADVADKAPPERIGHYRLLRLLGRGGMGVVYLADDEHLGRRVALKIMRGAALADSGRERFRREAGALAQLHHPGICAIHDAGDVDGIPFLAMRHIEGESLRARLDRWQTSDREHVTGGSRTEHARRLAAVVGMVEQIAHATHAMHEQGVIHRDLKPDNIAFDSDDRPVVLDFGLAGLLDATAPTLTLSSDRIGTPAYMAPEQVRGNHDPDRRTDVHGLGVLLYECATLQPPFAAPRRELLYRCILTEAPRDPRRIDPAISRDLAAVIQRAMGKEPGSRYATALELAEELGCLRRGEPVRTRLPGPAQRAWRWCRRNLAATTVLLTVSAALVLALLLLRARAETERQLRALAILRQADAVQAEEPELACKLAGVAVALDGDPVLVARTQELLFSRPDVRTFATRPMSLERVLVSARHVLALGVSGPAALYARDGRLIREFAGPRGVHGAIAPDDSELAIGGDDGSVQRYRTGTGTSATMQVSPPVTALAYGPDGELLVSHGMTTGATLWRIGGTRVELQPSTAAAPRRFWCGAFVTHGRIVASGALWNASGERLAELDAHDGTPVDAPRALACAQGRFLTWSHSRFCLWDATSGQLLSSRQFAGTGDHGLQTAALSADGARILVATADGMVARFAADGAPEASWTCAQPGLCIAFMPADDGIVVGDRGGRLHCLDNSLRPTASFGGHRGALWSMAWTPGARQLLTVGNDGIVRAWALQPQSGPAIHSGLGSVRLAADASAERFVAVGTTGTALCKSADGQTQREQPIPVGATQVALSPDGATAVVAGQDGGLLVWDLRSGQSRRIPSGAEVEGEPVVLLDGRVLWRTAGRWLGSCNLIGEEPPTVVQPIEAIAALAATGDGRQVLVGTYTGAIQAMSWVDGAPLRNLGLSTSQNPIMRLRLSRDGDRLLVAHADGQAGLWHLPSAKLLASWTGHRGAVVDIAFAPDEQAVVTACLDGFVRVFDLPAASDTVRSSALPARFALRHDQVREARFVRADRLVTGGDDGSVRIWSLTRADLLERLPGFRVPALSAAERERFAAILPTAR